MLINTEDKIALDVANVALHPMAEIAEPFRAYTKTSALR
jgi:hypothetical protein